MVFAVWMDLSVKPNQVFKDQVSPAASVCLHKQTAFRKPAKLDGRKTQILCMRTNLSCCILVIARQKNDSSSAMYGRILFKNRSGQMVEALHEPASSECLRDEFS